MRDATRGGLGAILAEIATQSELEITIDEKSIPVREEVRGVCEILGLDPLFLANEGKMALFCPAEEADIVLKAMKEHPLGRDAGSSGRRNTQRPADLRTAMASPVIDFPR